MVLMLGTPQESINHLPTQPAYHDITCRATRYWWADSKGFEILV
jgi:hypothetical protein